MTTRHVSAETDYPFEPELSAADALIVGGILDLYFVIQQPADRQEPSSSSSGSGESTEPTRVSRWVMLYRYEVIGSITRFTFRAHERVAGGGLDIWDIIFDVPNTGGGTGQVNNTDDTNVSAVLIYNSDNVLDVGSGGAYLLVEPSRAQFHVEQVDTLSFLNIARCAGNEYPDELLEVLTLDGSSSSGEIVLDLVLEDGYNCELEYDESLTLFGELDTGKGIAPDLGDTQSSCSEVPDSTLDDIITAVNGLAPVNGDIPINVSGGLGAQRASGQIDIVTRF